MMLFNSFKKMMATQIVSTVTAFLGVFVDIIVISRFLGTECMAAFGFVNPYILILVATGLVFTIGTQSKVGRLLGKCDIESVNKVVSLSLFVEIILSICFSLIAFFCSKNIVMFFGAKGVVLNYASEYLKYLSFGLYGVIMGPLLTALMQIDNDIPRSFISVFVMTSVNIILDVLNAIYFNGGMKGMAIATVVSTICNTTIMLFHFFKPNIMIHPNFLKIDFRYLKEIVITGLASATQQFCMVIRTATLNKIMFAIMGNVAVAAYTIQNGALPLIMAFINGIGYTTILVTSVVIGEEDKDSLKKLLKEIIKIAIKLSLIIFLVLFIFAKYISLLFVSTENIELYNMVVQSFRLYSFSLPFCMLVTLSISYLQSIKKLFYVNVMYIFEILIFIIAFSILFSKIMGVKGVWFSFVLNEICSLLLFFIIEVFDNKKFKLYFDDLLMLKDDFGVSDDKRISITVTSIDEAINISEKIYDFCIKNGIDKRRAIFSSLSMEEMSTFTLNKNKKCKVDVFVIVKENDIRIRLRDNGLPFDFEHYDKVLNPKDEMKNVAIRMFYKIVKDVKYNNLFGLNVMVFNI